MEEESSRHVFAREMRTLIAILVFFSTSYLIRVLTYSYIVDSTRINKTFALCTKQSSISPSGSPEEVTCIYFSNFVFFITMPIIFDFLPIGAVLYFHKRNFAIKMTQNQK